MKVKHAIFGVCWLWLMLYELEKYMVWFLNGNFFDKMTLQNQIQKLFDPKTQGDLTKRNKTTIDVGINLGGRELDQTFKS